MELNNPYLIITGIVALFIQIFMIISIGYERVRNNKLLRSLSIGSFFAIVMVGWSYYQPVLGAVFNYAIIIGVTYYEYNKIKG